MGNTTLGVMVTDDEAPGKRDDPHDPGYGRNAQVAIGRARYDLYSESHIGALVTDREFLDGYNRVGGVDGQFRLGRATRFNFVAFQSQDRDEQGVEREGPMLGAMVAHEGRHLQARAFGARIDPDFRTGVGFLQRVDQQLGGANVGYRWWPESWLISWGPTLDYQLSYTHAGIREDETIDAGLNFDFSRNINVSGNAIQAHERFGGVDFDRRNYSLSTFISTSRLFSLGGSFRWGDEIYYIDRRNPVSGTRQQRVAVRHHPAVSAVVSSQLDLVTSRFFDVRNGSHPVFDVQVLRALSTFTFTDRLLLRNITEYNSFRGMLGTNLLFTYRINALTVFYVGYDDHYRQEDLIDVHDSRFFQSTAFRRTNRALFTKLRILFRY